MNYFYIYNIHQANFFISNNLKVIEVGIGKKREFYTKFNRDSLSEKVFEMWINNK